MFFVLALKVVVKHFLLLLLFLFEFKKTSLRTTRDDDVDDFREKFFPNKVSVVLFKNALKEFLFRMTT